MIEYALTAISERVVKRLCQWRIWSVFNVFIHTLIFIVISFLFFLRFFLPYSNKFEKLSHALNRFFSLTPAKVSSFAKLKLVENFDFHNLFFSLKCQLFILTLFFSCTCIPLQSRTGHNHTARVAGNIYAPIEVTSLLIITNVPSLHDTDISFG